MSLEEDSNSNIPSDPKARAKIKAMVVEISDHMTIIEGYREKIKETIKEVSEEFDIKKKYLNKMAATYHRNNFNQQQQENEDIAALFEAVVGDNG
jgi:hypothetical protein